MPPLSVFSIAFLSLLAASRLEDSLPVSDSAANRVFDPTRNHTRHRFFNSTADVSDISDTIEGKADEANHRESEKRTPDGMRKSMTSDCGKPPEEREVWHDPRPDDSFRPSSCRCTYFIIFIIYFVFQFI